MVGVTRSRLSFEEFLALCPDERRMEWADGRAVEHVPPVTRHQEVVRFLYVLLLHFAEVTEAGDVLAGPYLMRLSPDGPAREPDILFVAREHRGRILRDRLEGPADLAVEVISDDSVARDRAEKFYEYQQFGVREYWLIDPRPGRERADFWELDAQGSYQPRALDASGTYRSAVLPGFWLKPGWLRADPLPPTLATFARIAGPDAVLQALRLRQP